MKTDFIDHNIIRLRRPAAMKIFYPNLAFEDELAGRSEKISEKAAHVASVLATQMALVADPGDCVIADAQTDPEELPDCLRHASFCSDQDVASCVTSGSLLVPWGGSQSAVDFAARHGLEYSGPDVRAVRTVNDRAFGAAWDLVTVGPPYSTPVTWEHPFGKWCRNHTSVQDAVAEFQRAGYSGWIAKPAFSHAARNRLVALGTVLNASQQAWLKRNLGEGVYLEPLVNPIRQAGLQFLISHSADSTDNADSGVQFTGVAEMITDRSGRYTGSMIMCGGELERRWNESVAHGRAVCRAAQQAGYSGPIGIDTFTFRTPGGQIATRLCHDINARFTMGRLALQLRKFLKAEQTGVWLHLSNTQLDTFESRLQNFFGTVAPRDVQIVRTSPQKQGGRPVPCASLLVICSSAEVGFQVAQLVQSA